MSLVVSVLATLLSLVCVLVGAGGVLGMSWHVALGWVVPLGGLELRLDGLGGFFLALVGAVALPASIYAAGYDRDARRGRGAYLLFVASMAVVTLAANALTFLIAWELMSLASYVLVLRDQDSPGAARAAWVYAVMTHAGFACLLAGMLLLGASAHSTRFSDWTAAAPALPATVATLVFVLLALGFAGKAGAIPLHVWLPLAHPEAPSHVSALMSGVMIKLGIYGLLRVTLEWVPATAPWWGVTILVIGTVSAVVGVLYALVDHDLKRLLAFHSIENIGIILIGLGAGLVFRAVGVPDLAVLALVAALYHTLNHAVFKACLFLGAGSVLHATGTRNMEEMGGLVRTMPWTAASFLVGSVAIAGLPPLNGFVSEWLTFQALLENVRVPRPDLNLVFALGIAGLALTAGLAAACFVKAFGITFLAMPRSRHAEHAHEAPTSMRAGMVLLAAACVVLGLGATVMVPALGGIVVPLVGGPSPVVLAGPLTLSVSSGFATLSTLMAGLMLVAGVAVAFVVLRLTGRGSRTYETWGCGRLLQTSRMEYTATAFANPFKRVFDFFYRPEKQLDIEFHPESRFFVQRIAYENPTRSIFEDWLYRPLVGGVRVAARRVRTIQSGSANLYLVYILAVLLVMLVLG